MVNHLFDKSGKRHKFRSYGTKCYRSYATKGYSRVQSHQIYTVVLTFVTTLFNNLTMTQPVFNVILTLCVCSRYASYTNTLNAALLTHRTFIQP